MRFKSILFLATCIIFGIGIYQIKYQVREREQRLAAIEKKISSEKQSIHMLSAEWSLLTAPDRLKKYADKNLDLQPAKANRIVSFADIPEKLPQENIAGESTDVVVGESVPHERLPEGFINSSMAAMPASDGSE